MSIAMSYDALSEDAERWDDVADRLATMRGGAVDGIDLIRGAFSFAATDAADLYATVHAQVLGLLADGGETQTRGAATALREIREEFETLEQNHVNDLEGLWIPPDA